jgi:rSAM/selenodomain-associated transferase 1
MKIHRIVIFAKAPRAGYAKTRLIPALGADGAARLARRMLTHMVNQALDAGVGPTELCMTPADDPTWEETRLPLHLGRTDQGEGDLGERMARASQRVTGEGEAIILTGTDCPQLDTICLQQIATALEQSDVAIVPTTDGGYAALGLNRFDPLLFSDIRWSTDTVAAETLRRIATLQWSVSTLPVLHDIDEVADLALLPADWPEYVRSE